MDARSKREIEVLRRLAFALDRSLLERIQCDLVAQSESLTNIDDQELHDYLAWLIRRKEIV